MYKAVGGPDLGDDPAGELQTQGRLGMLMSKEQLPFMAQRESFNCWRCFSNSTGDELNLGGWLHFTAFQE